jgi:hypothetical protein
VAIAAYAFTVRLAGGYTEEKKQKISEIPYTYKNYFIYIIINQGVKSRNTNVHIDMEKGESNFSPFSYASPKPTTISFA